MLIAYSLRATEENDGLSKTFLLMQETYSILEYITQVTIIERMSPSTCLHCPLVAILVMAYG